MRHFLATLLLCLAAPFPALAAEPAPHHEITLDFAPQTGRIAVTERIDVSRAASEQGLFVFGLAPWMNVVAARLDGQPVQPGRESGAYGLLLPDDAGTLELILEGRVPPLEPQSWSGGSIHSAEGSFLTPGGGWHADTGARFVTFDLEVRLPEGQEAAASGDRVAAESEDGVSRFRFQAAQASHPPAVFVGPYAVAERQVGPVTLRTYFPADQADLAPAYLEAAADYIERYSEAIGPYPYADFDIVGAPLPVGYGFRNLTYVSNRILALPYMRGRSLAHEVLHSWWGNGIAVARDSGNWAEGLTTYMADHALAADAGEAAAAEMRLGWLRDYAALPAERDIPVTDFKGRTHDASQVVGYGKVAYIFHMLKRELGAEVFAEGLQAFWRDHRGGAAGWSDLQAAFETASGETLDWFFEQWLARPGAPLVEIAGAEREPGDAHRVTLTLAQDAPAYRLRLPVLLETAEGIETRDVVLEEGEQDFVLEAKAPVEGLQLDPDQDVFRRLLPGEAPPILRDVTLSGETLTVLATDDPALREAAAGLAQLIQDRPPQLVPDEQAAGSKAPLLVMGAHKLVAETLQRLDLPATPPELAGRGDALVWTARREDGAPLLVVEAASAEALAALFRSLPRYGGKSFLVYEQGRAVENGVWPGGRGEDAPLARRFES